MTPAPAASARSHAAPRTYTWTEDGRAAAGTLADYARSYARLAVPGAGLSAEVRTPHAAYPVRAEVLAAVPGADGSWPVRLSVPGEQVTVRARAAVTLPCAEARPAAFALPAGPRRPPGDAAPRAGTAAAPGLSVLVCWRGAGACVRIEIAAVPSAPPPALPEAGARSDGEAVHPWPCPR